jgi:hypothetical protein
MVRAAVIGGQGAAGGAGARFADRRPPDEPVVAQAPLQLAGVRAHVHRDPPAAAGPPARQRPLPGQAVRALPGRRSAYRARARRAHHALSGGACVADGGDELLAARERRPPRRLSLDEAAHRRRRELATVVSDLDRRRVIDVLDGRSRRTVQRWLQALPEADRRSIEVVSIDPHDAYRQRSASNCRTPGSSSITSTSSAAPTPRWTPCAASDNEPSGGGGRRAPAAAATTRAGDPRSTTPDTGYLGRANGSTNATGDGSPELFAHEPLIAEAWGLKEAFRAVDRAADRTTAEQRLDAFLLAVGRAGIPAFDAFDAFANGHHDLAPRAAGLLRRTDQQRLRRRRHQQGQGDQATRLRTAHLHQLPQARRHSMRLTGTTRRHPALSARTQISTGEGGQSHRSRQKGPAVRRALAWPITSCQ